MATARELTERQRAFVREYVACGNAAQAARTAGYSEAVARQTAFKMLLKPHVAQEVRRQTAALVESHVPNAVSILSEVMNDAAVCPRDRVRAAEVLLKHARPGGPAVAVQVNVGTASAEVQRLIQEVWAQKQQREQPVLSIAATEQPLQVSQLAGDDLEGLLRGAATHTYCGSEVVLAQSLRSEAKFEQSGANQID
jgi:hypothetical protein